MDDIITILLISFISVSVLGVLNHFMHSSLKKGILAHIFSPVNESIWEHMKLSFYPMILIALIQGRIPGIYYDGFWGVAVLTILTGTLLIPILYYPIRKLTGREIPAISIGLYFVCIFIAYALEYILIANKFSRISQEASIIIMAGFIIMFTVFTYFPPKLPIFKDSIYKKYGDFKQKFDKKIK